jgi:hypothetical protein
MSKFREIWLPAIVTGVVFMLGGAWLGWWISRADTSAQIKGITDINSALRGENETLSQQEGSLEAQVAMLRDQKATLGNLVKELAATHRDVRLIFDAQGNVVGGQVLTNEKGEAITDEAGHPILTGQPRPH